jgi:glycosyltransferase involved in cell wall biosynthesis
MSVPVLLVCQELTQGGSERQLTEIALAMDRARFEPHVGVMRPGGIRAEEIERAGVPVTCFPVTSFRKPVGLMRAGRALRAYIREHKIALVHSFDTPGNVFATTATLRAGAKMLTSQRASRTLDSTFFRRLLRRTDRIACGVVVNCGALEKHLIEDERVAPGKIHVCHNGIDMSAFHPAPSVRPSALEGATLVIGVVCALRPEKGLATLVEAFAAICEVRSGMRLAIVGSGPVRDELIALARKLGIERECVFEPMTRDVVPWLRGIDIFVLPSLSEAFSNSIMEAMACGCTVIASRVGGNPELVEDRSRGLLFRAGDAADLAAKLRELIADEPLRRSLAEAGTAWVRENLSREASAHRMEAIYTQVLGLPA